ncbi:hypothetical protein Tco_0685053 [Tanacetum coccineum]
MQLLTLLRAMTLLDKPIPFIASRRVKQVRIDIIRIRRRSAAIFRHSASHNRILPGQQEATQKQAAAAALLLLMGLYDVKVLVDASDVDRVYELHDVTPQMEDIQSTDKEDDSTRPYISSSAVMSMLP